MPNGLEDIPGDDAVARKRRVIVTDRGMENADASEMLSGYPNGN